MDRDCKHFHNLLTWILNATDLFLIVIQDQSLGGWTLLKSHTAAPDISFQIPSPYTLKGGHTLTVSGQYVTSDLHISVKDALHP